MDQYVIWTGHAHRGAPRSRIAECVATMQAEGPWKPESLRALYQRVSDGGARLNPDDLKTALRLHQRACPAVLIVVRRGCDGSFRTAYDIPMGLGSVSCLSAGTLIRPDGADEAPVASRRFG